MFTPKQYIEANAPTEAENWIKFYLWRGRSFRESLHQSAEYLREYHYAPADEFNAAVVDILRKITTPQALTAFINKRRPLIVRPCYKTAATYIKGEFETDCTAADIARIIKMEVTAL